MVSISCLPLLLPRPIAIPPTSLHVWWLKLASPPWMVQAEMQAMRSTPAASVTRVQRRTAPAPGPGLPPPPPPAVEEEHESPWDGGTHAHGALASLVKPCTVPYRIKKKLTLQQQGLPGSATDGGRVPLAPAQGRRWTRCRRRCGTSWARSRSGHPSYNRPRPPCPPRRSEGSPPSPWQPTARSPGLRWGGSGRRRRPRPGASLPRQRRHSSQIGRCLPQQATAATSMRRTGRCWRR
jgi:hypothetical protein